VACRNGPDGREATCRDQDRWSWPSTIWVPVRSRDHGAVHSRYPIARHPRVRALGRDAKRAHERRRQEQEQRGGASAAERRCCICPLVCSRKLSRFPVHPTLAVEGGSSRENRARQLQQRDGPAAAMEGHGSQCSAGFEVAKATRSWIVLAPRGCNAAFATKRSRATHSGRAPTPISPSPHSRSPRPRSPRTTSLHLCRFKRRRRST